MSKMEILIGVKNLLRLLGVLHFEHPFKNAINLIQIITYFCAYTLFYSSTMFYFYLKAETFAMRSESFSYFISTFVVFNEYFILIWQREQILENITLLELAIQKRMTLNSF